jgi:hypothetical protein
MCFGGGPPSQRQKWDGVKKSWRGTGGRGNIWNVSKYNNLKKKLQSK